MRVEEFAEFYVSRIEDGYIRYEGPYKTFEEAKEKNESYDKREDGSTWITAIEAFLDGELYIYDYSSEEFDQVYKNKVHAEPVDQKIPEDTVQTI